MDRDATDRLVGGWDGFCQKLVKKNATNNK
jgi:hypothetical protein